MSPNYLNLNDPYLKQKVSPREGNRLSGPQESRREIVESVLNQVCIDASMSIYWAGQNGYCQGRAMGNYEGYNNGFEDGKAKGKAEGKSEVFEAGLEEVDKKLNTLLEIINTKGSSSETEVWLAVGNIIHCFEMLKSRGIPEERYNEYIDRADKFRDILDILKTKGIILPSKTSAALADSTKNTDNPRNIEEMYESRRKKPKDRFCTKNTSEMPLR